MLPLARSTDLVCLSATEWAADAVLGLHTFEIPLEVLPLEIGMAWHPRHEADPAHRWFRNSVRTAVSIPSNGSSARRPES